MLGYLGPAGTFTHQALPAIDDSGGAPFAGVGEALDVVRQGHVDGVVVPIKNSVEGGVSATLDKLVDGDPLVVTAEVVIPVGFGIYVRPGTTLDDVTSALTHGHAVVQCHDWLTAMILNAQVTEAGSTAGAAKEVADPTSRYDAAICARVAGRLCGLEGLARSIEDNPDAATQLVVVSYLGRISEHTDADKATLVAYMHQGHLGTLLEVLQQFAVRGVNLCRIESRPTETILGSYCFVIDARGHLGGRRLTKALLGLRQICRDVISFGSYPRTDIQPADMHRDFDDEAFEEASEWLQSLGTDWRTRGTRTG